ncbi:MAG: endolytic transglycosylase MltG [Oscillospiraceae bacterium]|jgi:conserved hypothetical protein, YceG family|nr:endolytic transglycosylase MltG [Oscillospiraceae bacterium]
MAHEFEKNDEAVRAESAGIRDRTGEGKSAGRAPRKAAGEKSAAFNGVDKLLIDETGDEAYNYTGDETSERDYRPIRQSHEYRSGCLGGIMYFVFILCVSVVLACLTWMAASDMLALNKSPYTTTVTLPMSIFSSETVDTFDEDGVKTGTKRVTHADMEYVAQTLKEAGLIEYKWLFEMFARFSHADTKIKPGEYELQSTFDYRALVQNMRPGSGSAVTVSVTFPEGYSMRQIFLLLEEKGVANYDDLMNAAATYKFNYDFLDDQESEEATRLEGFLFPDTYEFYVGMQPSSAINKFLENFHYRMTAELLARMEERGQNIHEVITIASMIEKEAANDNERAAIASVIYNRLRAGMPLGIDATTLYLYPDHEGAPTAAMLEEDTPYNTRLYTGLTPTPICSPGLTSIRAALYPESTNFYYYALDTSTGLHKFFTNANEFNKFVATQNY